MCAQAQATLARAGRSLHDNVGPQLAGAGMLLSLVKSDFPKATPAVDDILAALDQAMVHVRALSQELNASPVDRLGLQHALRRFSTQDPRVEVTFSATAKPSREVALNAGAKRVRVRVTGSAGMRVRVADDGRVAGRLRALAITTKLAQAAGATVTISTIKSTIVSISYGVRRSAGR